jgi:hypothetical protein
VKRRRRIIPTLRGIVLDPSQDGEFRRLGILPPRLQIERALRNRLASLNDEAVETREFSHDVKTQPRTSERGRKNEGRPKGSVKRRRRPARKGDDP